MLNPAGLRWRRGGSARAVEGVNPTIVSVADLPTRFGAFRAVAFGPDEDGREHLALVRGRVRGRSGVPVRIHSECLTGDVLGSLRCDCRDQLQAALETIGDSAFGVVLYLRQEGRGIGLTNKIRAYALQDRGYDTIDANRLLGFADDERDYGVGAGMLGALGVRSVRLMTNNPAKVRGLRSYGVRVAGRIPLVIRANPLNRRYLATKQKRAGHLLGIEPRAARHRPGRAGRAAEHAKPPGPKAGDPPRRA